MQCFGGYMKVQELKENTPLKVVQVLRHYERPRFDYDEPRTIVEEEMVQTRIFTDGEIASESEEVTEDIDEYYFGREKYKQFVDTLKTKDLYFKNHSFVITYTIAQEWTSVGRVHGWFDIIKDVRNYKIENKLAPNANLDLSLLLKEEVFDGFLDYLKRFSFSNINIIKDMELFDLIEDINSSGRNNTPIDVNNLPN